MMHVSQISVTAVKGLALHHPDHVQLTSAGVVGDRAFFLIDHAGDVLSCDKVGALMQHTAHYDSDAGVLSVFGPRGVLRRATVQVGGPTETDFEGLRWVHGRVVVGWAKMFSRIVGRPVRLIMGATGGYDIAPVTLISATTTEALGRHAGSPGVDVRRFRMNLEISGSGPLEEDTWQGRELRLGKVVLRVGGPVQRCAATTRNPDTGTVDLQTLRMIRAYKGRTTTLEHGPGFYLGVYAEVTAEGLVRRGDDVELV